jgi:CheY-like chemotaxis protein
MSFSKSIVFHLVDDNDIDIAVNSKLLQLVNLTTSIHTYSGGVKFIKELKENPNRFSGHHNIVLLDIMMPISNGFDCLDYMQTMTEESQKDFTVFMLSSTIDRKDIQKAEAYPMVERVLEKPLDVYLLKRAIQLLNPEV